MTTTDTLTLKVVSREGVIYQESSLTSVSSINSLGPFDVLPLHSQFVATVSEYLTARRGDKILKKLPLKTGLLRVKANFVEVYLGV